MGVDKSVSGLDALNNVLGFGLVCMSVDVIGLGVVIARYIRI